MNEKALAHWGGGAVAPNAKQSDFIKVGRDSFTLNFFFWRKSPLVGQGLPIHEVPRSHTTTHHSRYDSSGRGIISSERPLPDNTQDSQQTDIHDSGGIQIHSLNRRAVTGTGTLTFQGREIKK